MSKVKKIITIELYRINGELTALAVGFNPKSNPATMARLFTNAILEMAKIKEEHTATVLTILTSAVENLKMEFPEVAAAIRRQHIDHLKKNNQHGNE